MKIVIGCSMRYRDLAKEVFAKFEKLGITPLFPNLHHTNENIDKGENEAEKKRFAIEHYKAIDEADIVYLLVPTGHMGTSLKLELGYAIAKNKIVCFSETTNDPALDCYVSRYIDTNSLESFLEL